MIIWKKWNHIAQTAEIQPSTLTNGGKRIQYIVIAMTELRFSGTHGRELAAGASQSCAEGRPRSRAERLNGFPVGRSGSFRYQDEGLERAC